MNAGTLDIGIAGIAGEVSESHLVVTAERPLRLVTTAPVGGELHSTRHFLSLPAPRDLDCDDPGVALQRRALELGIDVPFVGFLTAVKLTNAVVSRAALGDLRATVVATVGVANATRPGEYAAEAAPLPGTINLIVLVDGNLTAGALTEALATAAEAKALTVYEGGVRTPSGGAATGTSTDAYAVACTGRGPLLPYAGSVAPAGYVVGRAVREAVAAGLGPALARMPGEAST